MRVRSYLMAGVSAATLVIGLTGCPGVIPGADPSTSTSPAPTSNGADSSVHEGTISSNQTWTKAKSPHIVRGHVYVESATGATLTIEPGAEVRFEQGGGLYFGWNDGTSGVLKAEGTSTESITFTSANANQAKGDWDQIYFASGGAASALSNVKVMYGGGDGTNINTSVLRVYGNANKPTVRNCTFENNNGTAIYLENGASFTAFENNTIKGSSESPIELDANAAGSLGAGNTFVSNGRQGIEILGSTVTKNVRWRNFGVPYMILDKVYVEGSNGPVLTLDAGNTLRFSSGAGMYVAWDSDKSGALYAVGTSTEKITFTGIESNPNAGAWDELYFGAGTVKGVADTATTTYLKNVDIQYAGGAGEYGAVRVYGSQPLFESVSIHDHAGFGLYVDNTGNTTPPLSIMDGITFDNKPNPFFHPLD